MNSSPIYSVCVAIPTFRRPALLAQLIKACIDELSSFSGTIIVADNEASEAVRQAVETWRDVFPRIFYGAVPARGISNSRNALVDMAFEHAPDFELLIMYDDDAVLRLGCLGRLVAGAEWSRADITGGPATGLFPVECESIFARNSVLAYRSRWPTGPVASLEMTQNIAIARSLFDRIDRPLFNPRFGLTGGEDIDFFRRAKRAGAQFAWVDEAVIDEVVPPERATTKSVVHRAFTTGAALLVVDRQYERMPVLALQSVVGAAVCAGGAVTRTLIGRHPRAARDFLGVVYYAGRIASLLGWRGARYA